MKHTMLLCFVFLFGVELSAQEKAPKVSLDTLDYHEFPGVYHNAFKAGEYLRFRLAYGLVDAGEAELTIHSSPKKYKGREAYHIVGKGRTLGAFNWFYKVDDTYETYLDKKGTFPWEFVRDIREGGYTKFQNYKFHQDRAAVSTHKGDTFGTLAFAQDMLSSFYFARTLDFTNVRVGDVFTIPTFVDEENYPLKIKFIGRETLKTRTGKYRCLKFVPVLQEGRVFEDEDDMTVWITDDANKIPVLAKAKVLVGSIKMELAEYKNLRNPMAKVD
ncbi:MAG: DUF3108 domain-containing protein [Cryomorphaceae bacterium]